MLSKNLKLIKFLHSLILKGCNLDSQSIKIISQNLNENEHLECINFSCNKIDKNGKLFYKSKIILGRFLSRINLNRS